MRENNVIHVDFHSKEKITPKYKSNFLNTVTLKIKKIFNRKPTNNKNDKISSNKCCSNDIP